MRTFLRGVSLVSKVCGFAMILTALGSTAGAVDIVPEMGPESMASALTLLVGGSLLVADRFGRKS